MITKDMTLADVVKVHPNTIGFLNGLHLDYCCGGHDPIGQAVAARGLDVDKFLKDLNEAADRPTAMSNVQENIEAFKVLSVDNMLDSLEATHHVTERQMMAEAEQLMNKILIVHYPHHSELLTQLHHLYGMLKIDLEEHFAKEERLVFPLMHEHPHPDADTLAYVKELIEEHSDKDFTALLSRTPQLALKLLELYAQRIADTENQTRFLTMETRLATYLQALSLQVSPSSHLTLPMKMKDLASYLGTTPETLSRKLHNLEDKEIISRKGRKLRILSPSGLNELAEN